MKNYVYGLIGVLACAAATSHAVQVCELNGQHVNPANGHTTAGKTGLMRCRDGEGGPVVREQELQNGVFMGVVRYFKDGKLEREYSVNERGNREGRFREFFPGSTQVAREETARNSTTVGIARSWYESGQLKQVSFYNEKGQSEANAAFTADGKLSELRCARIAQLAPHADDATWCGHSGGVPATVTLYRANGQPAGKLTHERGERRYSESLWDNGKPRNQMEATAQGRIERSFAQDGTKRRETQWTTVGSGSDARQITVLDREYHENGTLTRERKYTPVERGAELQVEQRWYLNGQPREKLETLKVEGRAGQRVQQFHDTGRPSSDGVYIAEGRYGRQPVGVHKSFDINGSLRGERHYDARGRVQRERELDENGKVIRDEELFEDGSRKAYAR